MDALTTVEERLVAVEMAVQALARLLADHINRHTDLDARVAAVREAIQRVAGKPLRE